MLERQLPHLLDQLIEIGWRKAEFLLVNRAAHLVGGHRQLLNDSQRCWWRLELGWNFDAAAAGLDSIGDDAARHEQSGLELAP